jgi:putative ABC transport system substrate-binding protein
MKRREFIAAATAALLVSPRRSWTQGKPRRIGFLGVWADEPARDPWLSGLREKGWIEGKNVLVEYRYAPDRLPDLASELAASAPELIIAQGPQAAKSRSWSIRITQCTGLTSGIFFVSHSPEARCGFANS